MSIKDEFIEKIRRRFEKALLEKLIGGKNPIINGAIIGNLIDALELTDTDVLALVTRLCCKQDMHPVIYKKSTIKFVTGIGIKKIEFIISNYN